MERMTTRCYLIPYLLITLNSSKFLLVAQIICFIFSPKLVYTHLRLLIFLQWEVWNISSKKRFKVKRRFFKEIKFDIRKVTQYIVHIKKTYSLPTQKYYDYSKNNSLT